MSNRGLSKNIAWCVAVTLSAGALTSVGWVKAVGGQTTEATVTYKGGPTAMVARSDNQISLAGSMNVYSHLIQPIFVQNCIMCHGVNRQKGHLRLDSYRYVMYGKFGHKVVIPRAPDHSILMRRVLLPVWNHHRMPPHGHAGLAKSQIALLHWWIQTGASDTGTLASLHADSAIDTAAREELQIVKRFMPQPIAKIKDEIRQLENKTGVTIRILRAGLPWISCDASRNSKFDNRDLRRLAHIASNIVVLNLGGTKVTDGGLATVSRMVNLMYLHLEHTAITNAGLDGVNHMGHLHYLNVTGTHVTAAGVNGFKRRNHLWRLWVVGAR